MPTAREIGALVVDMRANSTKFVRGMREAGRAMTATEQRSKRLRVGLAAVAKVGAAVAATGVAIGAAYIAIARNAGRSAAELRRASEQIGLSTETLQQFRGVAATQGLEFDDVEQGLTDLVEKYHEAAQGSEEYRLAFRRANGEFADGLTSSQDILNTFFDSYQRLSRLEQIQIGRGIFGDDAFSRFSPLIAGGSQAVNQRLGQAAAPLSDQDIQNLIDFNNTIALLSSNLELNLAAAVAQNVDELTDLATFVNESVIPMFFGMVRAGNDVVSFFELLRRAVPDVDAGGTGLGLLLSYFSSPAPAPFTGPPEPPRPAPVIPPVSTGQAVQVPTNTQAQEALQAIGDQIRRNQQDYQTFLATLGETDAEAARIRTAAEALQAFDERVIRASRALEDARQRAGTPEADAEIRRLEEELATLRSVRQAYQGFAEDLGVLAAVRVETEQQIHTSLQQQQEQAQLYAAIASEGVRAFADIASGAESASDAGQRLLSTLIQLAAQVLLIRPLEQALAGGGLSGGLFSFFTAQHGGLHQGVGLVGEDGPEVVDFTTPGRVYSNDELTQALAGNAGRGGLTVNVYGNADPTAIRAVIYETAPQIEAGARAGIAVDAGRPGHLRDRIRGRA